MRDRYYSAQGAQENKNMTYTPISYEPSLKRPEPGAVQHALVMLMESAGVEINLSDAVRSITPQRYADDESIGYRKTQRFQGDDRRRVFLKVNRRNVHHRPARTSAQIWAGDF